MDPDARAKLERQRALMAHARKSKPYAPRTGSFKKGPHITPKRWKKALEASGGLIATLAERLAVKRQTIRCFLNRNPWAEEQRQKEEDTVLEDSEKMVHHWIVDKDDPKNSSATARWFLERKGTHKGYKPKTEVTVEGGKTPLAINSTLVEIPLESLPLDLRIRLLEQMDAKPDANSQNSQPNPPPPSKKSLKVYFRDS